MVKSVLLVLCSVVLLLINVIVVILKKQYSYAMNDESHYYIVYQRWIRSSIFVGSQLIGLFSIYFSINFKYFYAVFFVICQFVLVLSYILCKFNCTIVSLEDIHVQRLFTKDMYVSFSQIANVVFTPNTRMKVNLKSKKSFNISFNSDNFQKFFYDLLNHKVTFKTGNIPGELKTVYLSRFNIKINFDKKMYREFYQSKRYFRNSTYLFSARKLENHEYMEGFLKNSSLDKKAFYDIVKNDMMFNGFTLEKEYVDQFDGMEFYVILSSLKEDANYGRAALIYKDGDNYLVIYSDYLKKKEEDYLKRLHKMIKEGIYGDEKNALTRI